MALRSRYALAVLNIYASYAIENRRTWPTKETVARELGLANTRRVCEAVAALVPAGLMEPCGRAKNTAIIYILPWLPEPNGKTSPAVERMLPAACSTAHPCATPPNTLRQSAEHPAVERRQVDQEKIREDHLPSGKVDSPLAAQAEQTQDRPPASRPEAATPPAGERKDPAPTRSASLQERPPLTEQQECDGQANRILDEGMLLDMPAAYRLTAAKSAVLAYRRRWPHSWPTDWVTFADFPQLDGLVKDRAGWIWSHIVGYGSGDWTPENRDGSVRLWHAALLAGHFDEAMNLAGIENGYAPEREAAKHREPATKPRRGGTTIHQIGDGMDPDCRRAEGA